MHMDAIRTLIEKRIAALGKNYTQVSLEIGKNPAYVQQFLKRGTPRTLGEEIRKALAKSLECSENELKESEQPPATEIESPKENRLGISGIPTLDQSFAMGRTLPVYGRAQEGGYGVVIIPSNDTPVEWTFRPPQLESVEDAFAVYVWDNAMQPAYDSGDLVWVHPHQTIREGNDVLVMLKDGRALVKRLAQLTADDVTLQQFNPAMHLKFPRSDISSMKKIVGCWNG